MKKFLTLTCVAVLTFGLAAATYADVEFGASGFVRVRSAWYVNSIGAPDASADNWDDTSAWMDTRYRLKFTAKANDYASGVIYLEGDSTRWGEREAPRYYANFGAAGTGSFTTSGGRNAAGQWGADRAAVEVKQFYIDFKVPGTEAAPTKVQAGIIGLNYRGHVCTYTDGPGVRVDTKVGPVKIQLNWGKPEEGQDHMSDDADVYAARVVLAEGLPVRPGVYFMYYNINNYPLNSATATLTFPTVTETYPALTAEADFYWIGFQLDGKVGPVALKGDFVYVDGDVESKVPGGQDSDYSGWALYFDGSVPIDMFTVGGAFMYATGNDVTDTTKAAPASLDFDGYVVPPYSEERWMFNEGIVFWPSTVNDGVHVKGQWSTSGVSPGAIGGTWMAKLYGSVKPLEWLKVTAYGMYIGDTVDDGNIIGNARDYAERTGLEDESGIGIEIGAICDFYIYKNLTYSVGAGYLLAGDALDSYTGLDSVPGVIPINDEPSNPWAVVSQLIYKF